MTDLNERRTALIAYAQSCLASGDWHGLRDAACDVEIIEARIQEQEPHAQELESRLRKRSHLRKGR